MEPITIFAVSVGLIGTCRLTFSAVDFFGKGIYSNGIYFKKSTPVKRDDWYCFFKTSDLLGTTEQQASISDQQHLEQRRRVQQQRPRLQA